MALISPASAQTQLSISWGSSILQQRMVLQDGTSLDSGPIIMELGSFGSFVPLASNMDEWMDHWRVFDAITTPDDDPNTSDFFATNETDPTLSRYAGSANLIDGQFSDSEDAVDQNPDATFGPYEQGYVFFRTSDAADVSSQWLLFTSAEDSDGLGTADSVWQFPSVSGGQPQFSMQWWLFQADTAVVGAINGGDDYGGNTGGGTYTDTSNDFVLRLHNVPEPGASLLAFLSVSLMLGRRRE